MAHERKQRRRKPKQAPAAASGPDLAQPTAWRLQHGPFGEPQREVDPDTLKPVTRRRAQYLPDRMAAHGTITGAMRDSWESFHIAFRTAALDPIRPAPLLRVPGSTGDNATERTAAARRKVARAMDALGGYASAAGSCVWHVVGCETSIREWAVRQGWNGRPVGHTQAQGILIAALGVLAAHLGFAARGASYADPQQAPASAAKDAPGRRVARKAS